MYPSRLVPERIQSGTFIESLDDMSSWKVYLTRETSSFSATIKIGRKYRTVRSRDYYVSPRNSLFSVDFFSQILLQIRISYRFRHYS